METMTPLRTFSLIALGATLTLALGVSSVSAQIGGQVGGTLVIDDVEDLDLNAGGVGRDWISDFTTGERRLVAIDPGSELLTLAPGQSPVGVFRLRANNDTAGFFQNSAGVPVPSEPGESTLTHPGDMTSFDRLSFVAAVNPGANNLELQVILECYPQNTDSSFPTLRWIVAPTVGTTFTPVSIDLASPDLVTNNDEGRSVEELLSETRFLSFYLFAGQDFTEAAIDLYLDDITLEGDPPPTAVENWWTLYDAED